jgi:hypothetical protein
MHLHAHTRIEGVEGRELQSETPAWPGPQQSAATIEHLTLKLALAAERLQAIKN